MSSFFFSLRYAARNLFRERRWTIFAIFAIAAGVAGVVALRSLGLAVGDALIDNARNSLHGDIAISAGDDNPFSALIADFDNSDQFSAAQIAELEAWTAEQGGRMGTWIEASNIQIAALDATTAGRPTFSSMFLIDPDTYPPTGDVRAIDPAGVPLRDLLTGGANQIIVSENMAQQQGIAVGDRVRVTGTTEEFTVVGVAPTIAEAGLRDIFAAFFGFAYVHLDRADLLGINSNVNRAAIVLPEGADPEAAARSLPSLGMRLDVAVVTRVLNAYERVRTLAGDFTTLLSFGALLIGGVGISNTMLVLARRRTEEIAALKTFGLKGGQVATLFMMQALYLGALGSLLGCVFGILLSGAVNRFGETLIQQPLTWRIYPDALLYGLVLGMVFTLIFGLIPVLLTMRVRPAIILRPNENHVPAMGCFTTAGALSVIVLTIGVIVGSIVRNIPVGIIGVTVVLLIFGLLLVMMWVIVWLIGKLPSFGNVDLRLALRNLSTRRWRTAITLLALSAGMYALSILSLSAQGISEILRFQFANQLGGNVMVFSLASVLNEGIGQGLLDFEIGRLEGVENVTRIYTSTVRAVSVNGEDAQAIMRSNMPNIPGNRGGRFSPGNFLVVMIRDISNTDTVAVTSGRALTAEDRGENVIVVPNDGDWEWLGLQVGDVITVQQGGRNVDLTVVGTVEGSTLSMFNGTAYVPVDVLPAAENFPLTILRVAPEHLNQALIDLTANPVNLALDITFIDGLIGRLINQFAALPTVVGLLSLLAAATIMANTVALATLERRRQIGILKAVGLKGSRVLRIMLLENTLIGLLGALLGVGLSALFVAIMTQLSTGIAIPVPRESTLTVLALIAAAVGIAWLATFLSARQAAGERVLNVLRYE